MKASWGEIVTRSKVCNFDLYTQYRRYILVRQVIDTQTARYRAVPRSISAIGSRLREKSTVDGRLRKKKGRKRRGEEIIPRHPRPRAVAIRPRPRALFQRSR
ncbi:hypothetical protein BHE74_00050549 [Ensete ventricosum]|nr:hypothetical protein BHE74_00050549 [Ensete ventricosum]